MREFMAISVFVSVGFGIMVSLGELCSSSGSSLVLVSRVLAGLPRHDRHARSSLCPSWCVVVPCRRVLRWAGAGLGVLRVRPLVVWLVWGLGLRVALRGGIVLDGLRRDRCGAGTRGGLVGVEGVDGLLGDGHGALCAGRSLGGLVGASLLGGAGRYVQGGVGRGAWSGRWGRVVLITGCSLGWRRALGAETGMRWDSPALLVRGLLACRWRRTHGPTRGR